ncbi:uncharacterized protein A4U43_UnF8530 [Asparagus officinalis]|uniref:Condensin complex subunit 1 C-terminal domain-containing protein n=1 Tax=Asparagus officinalis TaxID=4686 RepID=A0A1R3L5X7_ASPOF|nr:uncharacterized protein A4U43_UnF8530 [Asparagus officinalis]
MQHIIPQVLDKVTGPHYLYRMTILQSISLLAPVMGAEITCQKLLPVIVTASKDRVPNIKFNVAKVLHSLVSIVDHSVVEETIKPCLVELSEDPDVDVREYVFGEVFALDAGDLELERLEDEGVESSGADGGGVLPRCEASGGRGLLVYGGNSPTNDRFGDIFFFA